MGIGLLVGFGICMSKHEEMCIKGPVNIYWGAGTGAKCSRTQTFYDEKLIGPKLFPIPSLIGQQLFLIMIFSNNKKK